EAELFEQADHGGQMVGDGAVSWRGSQAANEDAVIWLAWHPKAVAKKSAAGDGTLRIAGEYGYLEMTLAQQFDQLANDGTLADAGAAGDGANAWNLVPLARRGSAGGTWARGEGSPSRCQRQKSGERQPIPLPEALEEIIRHGPSSDADAGKRRYRP